MARIVIKSAHSPLPIHAGGKEYWICMCGLSKNQPFCDGAHKMTLTEDNGKLYQYNSDGTRTEIKLR